MNETDRAYERALSFLERRERTESEVNRKLLESGFSERAAETALERLRDAGLLDDAGYAARYLEALITKGRGRLRIAAEMRRKGLKEELVRNTLEDGFSSETERTMAAEAARRVMAEVSAGTDPRKAAAKVSRRLVSLGFPYEVIGDAMEKLRAGIAITEQAEEGY